MLCDDLEGWDGGVMGGRCKREGLYVHIYLTHFVAQQKLTHHCKAIILQLKKKDRDKREPKGRMSKQEGDRTEDIKCLQGWPLTGTAAFFPTTCRKWR